MWEAIVSVLKEIRDRASTQAILAFMIVVIGFVGIFVLSGIIIGNGSGSTENAKFVFNALLPLIGTWVGAILAFYFGKDNFETAARVSLSSQDKLRSTLVKNVMIPKSKLFFVDDQTTKLKHALDELKQRKLRRLPVLDKTGKPLYMIYVEGILDLLYRASEEDKDQLDFQALSDRPDLKRPFVRVEENATLADAKVAMDGVPDCRDVFVVKDDLVIGYLTNNDITKNAVV
jgi:predicted transcriptional regulator